MLKRCLSVLSQGYGRIPTFKVSLVSTTHVFCRPLLPLQNTNVVILKHSSDYDAKSRKKAKSPKKIVVADVEKDTDSIFVNLVNNKAESVTVIKEDGNEKVMKQTQANRLVKHGKTKLEYVETRGEMKVFRLKAIADTSTKQIQITENISDHDLHVKVQQAISLLNKKKRVDFKFKSSGKPKSLEEVQQVEKRIINLIPKDAIDFTIKSTETVIMLRESS